MITNDFRGHRVCRFVVREEGRAIVSRRKQEVINPTMLPFDQSM